MQARVCQRNRCARPTPSTQCAGGRLRLRRRETISRLTVALWLLAVMLLSVAFLLSGLLVPPLPNV